MSYLWASALSFIKLGSQCLQTVVNIKWKKYMNVPVFMSGTHQIVNKCQFTLPLLLQRVISMGLWLNLYFFQVQKIPQKVLLGGMAHRTKQSFLKQKGGKDVLKKNIYGGKYIYNSKLFSSQYKLVKEQIYKNIFGCWAHNTLKNVNVMGQAFLGNQGPFSILTLFLGKQVHNNLVVRFFFNVFKGNYDFKN